MLNDRAIEAFIMFKEKEVCESSIYDLWVFPAEFYKLEPFFAAVTSSPEGCGVLVFPRRASVCLDWHHIQADSAGERSDLTVKPIGIFLSAVSYKSSQYLQAESKVEGKSWAHHDVLLYQSFVAIETDNEC